MELVDITDLKSVGHHALAGSSPAAGTTQKDFAKIVNENFKKYQR